MNTENVNEAIQKLDTAQAENERLRHELLKHGWHAETCMCRYPTSYTQCTCDWDTLKKELEQALKAETKP